MIISIKVSNNWTKLIIFQSLSLGLFRSDYLMQKPDCNKIKQVEFNTVAASFGAMTSNLPSMFRYRHCDGLKPLI